VSDDPQGSARLFDLSDQVNDVIASLEARNRAREEALPACRLVIRTAGSSIRAVHRLDSQAAADLASESEAALRTAQSVLAPHPSVATALVAGVTVPGPDELSVSPTAWMRGLAEAASELRRHLLDRLREGKVDRAEALLASMDDVYSALVVVDYPDALTNGLRRTLDALRAVLERSRGDVTTTVLQTRLQGAIERHQPG